MFSESWVVLRLRVITMLPIFFRLEDSVSTGGYAWMTYHLSWCVGYLFLEKPTNLFRPRIFISSHLWQSSGTRVHLIMRLKLRTAINTYAWMWRILIIFRRCDRDPLHEPLLTYLLAVNVLDRNSPSNLKWFIDTSSLIRVILVDSKDFSAIILSIIIISVDYSLVIVL
mgnify:CR=1 FL=1